jgi:hypothetical protein
MLIVGIVWLSDKVHELCLRIESFCIVALVMAEMGAVAFVKKSLFLAVARMVATVAMAATLLFRRMRTKGRSAILSATDTGTPTVANTAVVRCVPDVAANLQ